MSNGVIEGLVPAEILGGTIENAGTIIGGDGIEVYERGLINNESGGLIDAGSTPGSVGVSVSSGAFTIENAGTISANAYAVDLRAASTDRLIVDPGAVFRGAVVGNNDSYGPDNMLELTAENGSGTLSGLGTQFRGFAELVVDSGADWTLSGTFDETVFVYGTERGGTLASGWVERVNAGGMASGTTVASGGKIVIAGAAANLTVESGGTEAVESGASFNGISVGDGVTCIVSAGGTASGALVSSGGVLAVISGAADNITLFTGGNEFQFAGSTSGGTLSGGHQTVLGGVASGAEVDAGGFQFAGTFNNGPAGGTVTRSLVHSGGILAMGAQGAAVDATIEGGAFLFELAGTTSNVQLKGTQYVGGRLPGVPSPNPVIPAVALNTTVWNGGLQLVNAHGSAVQTVVQSGGLVEVFKGGVANEAVIVAGGSLTLIGGAASHVTVETRGNEYQFDGRTSGVNLYGGHLTVLGGVAGGIAVDAGGFEFAGTFNNGSAGGTVVDSVVSSGGILATGVHGTVIGAVIRIGGHLFELAGVTKKVVLSGGVQFVGGQLPGVPLPNPLPAAVAFGTIVASEGKEQVNANGSAVGTGVLAGGEIVFNGGVVSGLSLSSGGVIDLAVFAFSSASSLSFIENASNTGGTLTVSNGTASLSIKLLGQYVAGGFHESAERQGIGTVISYNPPVTSSIELAGHHA